VSCVESLSHYHRTDACVLRSDGDRHLRKNSSRSAPDARTQRNCKPSCAGHSLPIAFVLPQPSCPLRRRDALFASFGPRSGGHAAVVGATPTLAEAFAAAGTASPGLSAARLLPLLTEPGSLFMVLLPPQRLTLAPPLHRRSLGLAPLKAGFVLGDTSSCEALDPII
jgi:hypothetical protein